MELRSVFAGATVVAVLLATVGIGAALTTSGVAPQSQAQGQQQAQLSNTITTSGSGTVQATADRAVVRVGVVARGDDVGIVREQLSENASSMRAALTEMGITSNQIRTVHFDISSERRRERPEGNSPTYRGTHVFAITIEDPSTAGQVIDTAVSNGASEVHGVEFTLSQERRQELRQQALQEAMANARSEASTVASSEDLSLTGVTRISTTDSSVRPFETRAAAADGGGGAETSIESGPVTVQASVTVVYETAN